MTFSRRTGSRLNGRGRIATAGGGGLPALNAEQVFGVEIAATVLEPLLAPSTFTVEIAATEGGFSPEDIAGGVVWFDMQDAAAYTEAGGFVTTVTNKASSVVWSAPAGERPAFSATGLNSLPCMDLDGANDRFISTEAAVLAALKDQLDYYLAAVVQADDLDAIEVFFGLANSGAAADSSKRWGTNVTGNGRWNVTGRNDAASTINVDSTVDTVNTPVLLEFYSETQATSIRVNGGAEAPSGTASAYGTLTPDQVAIGCRPSSTLTTHFDGRIGEIIAYSGAVSSENKALLRAYLIDKWAIT